MQRKLTNDQVRAIRARLSKGVSAYQIAKEMKLSHNTIWNIKMKATYQDVSDTTTQQDVEAAQGVFITDLIGSD